jgi:hypothetical protein
MRIFIDSPQGSVYYCSIEGLEMIATLTYEQTQMCELCSFFILNETHHQPIYGCLNQDFSTPLRILITTKASPHLEQIKAGTWIYQDVKYRGIE